MIKVEETNIKADYYNPDQLEFSDAEKYTVSRKI